MDWEDWVPIELREYIDYGQDNLTPEIIKMFKLDQREPTRTWLKLKPTEKEIENRILTDPRMKRVWDLFKKLPDIDRNIEVVNFFIQLRSNIFFDAQERKLTKEEREKIKNFKKSVALQIEKLKTTIEKVDNFCSELKTTTLVKRESLRGNGSLKKLADEVGNGLHEQLKNYKKVNQLRTQIIRSKNEEIKSRGKEDFLDMYIRETVSHLFRKLFQKPHYVPAQIVAWVILGKSTPTGITDEQILDRSRAREKAARARTRKK